MVEKIKNFFQVKSRLEEQNLIILSYLSKSYYENSQVKQYNIELYRVKDLEKTICNKLIPIFLYNTNNDNLTNLNNTNMDIIRSYIHKEGKDSKEFAYESESESESDFDLDITC